MTTGMSTQNFYRMNYPPGVPGDRSSSMISQNSLSGSFGALWGLWGASRACLVLLILLRVADFKSEQITLDCFSIRVSEVPVSEHNVQVTEHGRLTIKAG